MPDSDGTVQRGWRVVLNGSGWHPGLFVAPHWAIYGK